MSALRKCLILLMLLGGVSSAVFSQATEEEVKKEFYKSDMLISVLISYLPSNWAFSEANERFYITRTDSVWVLTGSVSDAPKESKEERNKRIQRNGKRTVCQIVLSYEDKWSVDKVQQASILNAAVKEQIRKLPEKHKITGLKDDKLSSKGTTVYTARTEADRKKIEKYEAEKKQLEATLLKVPDFNSEKYSLFIVSQTGAGDENHLVFPDQANVEFYTVMATCREVLGK